MNSSFAIWYKPTTTTSESSEKPSVKLHINLWINDHKERDFIDFGFMINNPKTISEFFFYIPSVIRRENIELLIPLLTKNHHLASLVFNTDVIIGTSSNQVTPVTIKNYEVEFYSLNYDITNKFNNAPLEVGSILQFKFDGSINNKDKYIRFRLKGINKDNIVQRVPLAASYISGVSNNLVTFEINMNVYRKLPKDINQFANDTFLNISRVDLFVMTDIEMQHTFSSAETFTSRILEKKDWIDYNQQLGENKNKNILAYHFKQNAIYDSDNVTIKEFIREFTIFNKFAHEYVKIPMVALLVIFSIGFLGSILTNIQILVMSSVTLLIGIVIGFFISNILSRDNII